MPCEEAPSLYNQVEYGKLDEKKCKAAERKCEIIAERDVFLSMVAMVEVQIAEVPDAMAKKAVDFTIYFPRVSLPE